MKFDNPLKFIFAVIVAQLAGVAGSLVTLPVIESGWYENLAKPALNPPDWVFGPVWTTLYLLMGVSLYLAWKNNWKVKNRIIENGRKAWNPWSERLWTGNWQKQNVIAVFGIQLALNLLWSFIFFGLQLPGPAFFEILALWFAALYTLVNFYRISKFAAWLLLPYLIWVSFAAYLNFAVWLMNL